MRDQRPSARSDRFCRHCDAYVVARRASPAWRLALAAVGLGMVGAVLVASLIGPFIMFAIPFMALFGFALGPLSWLSSMPASCPRCHREVVFRHRHEVPARRALPAVEVMRRAA